MIESIGPEWAPKLDLDLDHPNWRETLAPFPTYELPAQVRHRDRLSVWTSIASAALLSELPGQVRKARQRAMSIFFQPNPSQTST